MAKKLIAPDFLDIDFQPSPRQYDMWKMIQPECHICGGKIDYVENGADKDGSTIYTPSCTGCGNDNVPQLVLAGERKAVRVAHSRLILW